MLSRLDMAGERRGQVVVVRKRKTEASSPAPTELPPAIDPPAVGEPFDLLRGTTPSVALLGKAGVLLIEHAGRVYTLRRNKNGRLVLTA
jgi:hypothetical protein